MTIDNFINATLEVIAEDGIEVFLPTIFPLGDEEFQIVDGIPDDVDHREAIQKVIIESGFNNSDFFFCVRSAFNELTGGYYHQTGTDFFIIHIRVAGYNVNRVPNCEWWHVHP